MLDSTATIISYEEYHPYGTTSYRSGRTETEVSLKRYKYVGKERDEETGLYYYGARYYAVWLCGFVSVDALQFKYPELTPYQYASNNPVTMIDLDGNEGVKPEKTNLTLKRNRLPTINKSNGVDGMPIPTDDPSKMPPPKIDPSKSNYYEQIVDLLKWVKANAYTGPSTIPLSRVVDFSKFLNSQFFSSSTTFIGTQYSSNNRSNPQVVIQGADLPTNLNKDIFIINNSNVKIYYNDIQGGRKATYSFYNSPEGIITVVLATLNPITKDPQNKGIIINFNVSDPKQYQMFKNLNFELGGINVSVVYKHIKNEN